MKKSSILGCISFLFLAACSKEDVQTKNYQPNLPVDSSHSTVWDIIEYKPAPGQYMNETLGSQENAMAIAKDSTFSTLVSLGAFGGSITFKFDHTVVNDAGADIAVYGNPFSSWDEPGIVMVSYDANQNGLADDPWYELAGSQYDSSTTIHNYTVTYYNNNDKKDVLWKDNQGDSGYVKWNAYHNHNFYPLESSSPDFSQWQDSITFTGSLLRNTVGKNTAGWMINDIAGLGWWGYSDTYSSGKDPEAIDNYVNNKYNSFDIDWARDAKGNKITLNYVDFVKVYTGQLADAGISGEISTEFKGAKDLHISKK